MRTGVRSRTGKERADRAKTRHNNEDLSLRCLSLLRNFVTRPRRFSDEFNGIQQQFTGFLSVYRSLPVLFRSPLYVFLSVSLSLLARPLSFPPFARSLSFSLADARVLD